MSEIAFITYKQSAHESVLKHSMSWIKNNNINTKYIISSISDGRLIEKILKSVYAFKSIHRFNVERSNTDTSTNDFYLDTGGKICIRPGLPLFITYDYKTDGEVRSALIYLITSEMGFVCSESVEANFQFLQNLREADDTKHQAKDTKEGYTNNT